MKYRLIIFDVDGTLLDTSVGIINSVKYAIKMMNFNKLNDEDLHSFIGPSPVAMYLRFFHCTDEEAKAATKLHRLYGNKKGIYESKVYDNIPALLSSLKKKHYMLAVATLKSQTTTERILKIHSLYDYFDIVVGMDDSESLSKADIINVVKTKANIHNGVLMIGDSKYDYDGAKEAMVDFLGVTYGFGFTSTESHPFIVVNRPEEIISFLSTD